MSKNQGNQASLIKAITSPLGFFVLSLLIVEMFLSTILIFSNLDIQSKYHGMWLGVGLFVLIVVIVFVLVWFKPTHLTFGEKSHLDWLKAQKSWGTSDEPETKSKAENSPPSTPNTSEGVTVI